MPAPTLESQADVFGRIATLGAAYGIDASGLLDRLSPLAPELASFALVAVPGAFDRLIVTTPLARQGDSLARAARIAALGDPAQTGRLDALTDAGTRALHFEAETVPGDPRAIAISLQAFGARALDRDLPRLAQFGVPAHATDALAAAAASLDAAYIGIADRAAPPPDDSAEPERSWTLTFEHRARDTAALGRVLATAEQLAATKAQRHVVEGLFATLAQDRETYAWLRVRPAGLDRALGIQWRGVAWEHAVRMMIGFYPNGSAPTKLGELAGAFGADAAAAVELVLGPSEPPRMRVATTLTKGRTPS
jgi:hypothetical protein